MQLGHLLIDEFTTLRAATSAHHLDDDQQTAYDHMRALAVRLRNSPLPDLDAERKLVNSLTERLAFLSGNCTERGLVRSSASRLWGLWRIRSVQGQASFRPNDELRGNELVLEERPGTLLFLQRSRTE
jgi:hypothetical protein